jgi:hypothetical protein
VTATKGISFAFRIALPIEMRLKTKRVDFSTAVWEDDGA